MDVRRSGALEGVTAGTGLLVCPTTPERNCRGTAATILWLPKDREGRIAYHLAMMLEKGEFEVWRGDKIELSVYRVQIDMGFAGGRLFELLDCQELLQTSDWMT